MPINDDNLGWNRRRLFIPVRLASGVLDDLTSGVPASLGAGTPVFAELSAAFELIGMPMAADADELYHFMPIPWDMDVTHPFRFRVWFMHTSTDADTPIFSFAYKGVGKQVALSDAKSTPDETVTLGAHTCSTTANSMEVTAWGESASDAKLVNTDFAMIWALTCDTISASANEVVLLGVELDYVVGASPNPARLVTKGQPTTGTSPND